MRKPSLIEMARWLDGKNHFQERISTALELFEKKENTPWRDLLVTDAVRCAQEVNPKRMMPFHLPSVARWAVLLLVVSAGLGFIPEYRTQAHRQREVEAQVIQDTGRQLALLTRRSLEQRPPVMQPTKQSLTAVAELGDHMAKAKLSRDEALSSLANMADKLQQQAKSMAQSPVFEKVQKAAQTASEGGAPALPELQKQIEALKQELGNPNANPDELAKLQRALEKAQQAAAGLQNQSGTEAENAQQELGNMLADLADQAQEIGLQMPGLEEAIAALASSDIDKLLRDLDAAEIDLQKLQSMAQALKKLEQKEGQIGRTLAEQLENGQATVAQTTLEGMARQLNSGELSPAELKEMAQEIADAVKPGSQYGEAGDHLKQALQQLKAGEQAAAAGALSQAAQELDQLMKQMADVQSILSSMEALQRAQMAVGNGQTWSNTGPPRAGIGSGVGSGVGTWADDSRWLDVTEINESWDNSGVVRPDTDARGVSDRGEGQLPDALLPTKVKGEMNASGGPMPSITLRGVSIKGLSKVEFSEIATAAQTDAQSALSQEKVPRAYQEAVRDYFDDLKE